MKTPRATGRRLLATLALPAVLSPFAAAQTNGTWNTNTSANWSATGSWLGGNIADGIGASADFSQFNITTGRTATIDTTSRTLGTLLFGDSDGSHGYTIAASGGATLTFNNNSLGASITQGTNSGANAISVPILLADNLGLSNNNATAALTLSGTISSGTAGTKTLTNQGSGTGGVTISGVVSNGTGSVAIVQNSATSQLTLTGANTFDTGVLIKQGTLVAGGAGPTSTALGSGTLLLGDTTGSATATFAMSTGSSVAYNNAIIVQAGGTGKRTITHSGNGASARPNGNILLNSDLTLEVTGSNRAGSNAGAFLATGGVISGTGNLNLEVNGGLYTTNNTGAPQSDSLNVIGNVTTSGAINNVGTGEGRAIISGNISNVSGVNQNSATSMLTLSGTNTYTTATTVNAGVLRIGSTNSLPVSSTTTVASGATLQFATTLSGNQALTISGSGTAYSNGAIESTNNGTYSSAIVLAADSTVGSSLATTTLTLSGGITGDNTTLTTSGAGNHALSGVIATGSGGLIKEGTGTTTLSGANTYTGLTRINQGTLAVTSAGSLGGGGNITFDGGSLRHSSSNLLDYSGRIVNSTGPIAIDTNAQTVTYAGNIDSTNTGGFTKLGTATLTLSGTNAYSGITTINAGGLAISSLGALPSGSIFIDAGGVLNGNGAYSTAQAWLDSGKISTGSTGGLALTDSSNVDLTGFGNLMLVTSTGGNTTYTGTITPAGGLYRLGGTTSSTSLTLSNANALTGTNGLVVGAKNGASTSGGTVILSNSNNLTGTTTVDVGTLSLTAAGTIAGSAVTVNSGATLAITSATSGSPVARASSVTLNRGTLTITGNSTANSTDTIANALAIGAGGNSTITLTQSNARNLLLSAGSYDRTGGGTALIRGTSLGVNAFGTVNSTNISFTTPNLVGNDGTGTDRSIFVGVVGDTAANGTGFGATGGLLTYDATNGVRRLSGSDYKTSITDGQTTLDNVQLTSTGTTATTTLNSATTLNSLSLNSTTATGANIQVTGTGTLKLNSGVIYAGSVTATTASGISNAIDFNGREGIILAGGSSTLGLSGVLSNTGGNGLTIYGNSTVTLSGASANTYTGTTTVNGGTLALNKTAGLNALGGNLVINTGGTVSYSAANQIADSANITINGGSLSSINDTINDLTLTSGTATAGSSLNVAGNLSLAGGSSLTGASQGTITVTGATNLSDGGTITLARSQNINGVYDSVTTLGALNITNRSSGAYTAITIGHGSGLGQSGAKLILGGDVTFTGNSTNTNTVLIDAIKGTGRQGVIELTAATPGNRTFNIGNGAAATDLRITAGLLDGAGGASGLIKTGAGVLALSGASTYSGNTTVSAGGLVLEQGGSLTFYIGANGVNNAVTGTGTATFNGTFKLDLSNAVASNGNSWTLVNTGTLSESFAGSFVLSGFTESANVWTNGSGYSFSESTGILSYSAVPEPSSCALLAGAGVLLLGGLRRRRAVL